MFWRPRGRMWCSDTFVKLAPGGFKKEKETIFFFFNSAFMWAAFSPFEWNPGVFFASVQYLGRGRTCRSVESVSSDAVSLSFQMNSSERESQLWIDSTVRNESVRFWVFFVDVRWWTEPKDWTVALQKCHVFDQEKKKCNAGYDTQNVLT